MEEKNQGAEVQSGLAKKKAINRAASYFSDDDTLFEFEAFEIEELAKDINELAKKESAETAYQAERLTSESVLENTDNVYNKTDVSSEITDIQNPPSGINETQGVTAISEAVENSAVAAVESEEEDNNGDGAKYEEEDDSEEITVETEDFDNGPEVTERFTEEKSDEEDNKDDSKDPDVKTEYENDFSYPPEVYACPSNETGAMRSSSLSQNAEKFLAYNEERPLSAEGQMHFEGTVSDFYDADISGEAASTETNENNGHVTSENELKNGEGTESTEDLDNDLYDEEDLDNEIWDRAGKEEWEKRESFISFCRSLTLPQLKNGNYENVSSEVLKAKAKTKQTSSGYRYAKSERIPVFSDGMNGGADKSGYAEREKRYCENRKARREIALREKTRASHRGMIYTALVLLTMFLLEILNFAIAGQDVLFTAIEIGLTVLGAAFIWRSLGNGLRCACRGEFVPEILSFLTVLLSLVYSFSVIFSPVTTEKTVLIGLPGGIAIFLTAVYSCLMSEREKKVFDITADYGYYCTEVRLASFKGSPEEIAFGGYADENSSLYKTNRIPRSDGGYNLQPVKDECFGLIKILLICIVCAAIASGIAFGFIRRDPYYGIFSAYMLISLSCPFCVFLSLALPRHIVATDIAEDGAAITDFDDESDEFDESVIMLNECELFPPENIRILDTYWTNSHFLENHLAKAAAAFKKTGGLLSGLFSSIDLPVDKYRDVVVTDISDGGISVRVDDSLVRAGTDAYLEKHGIEILRYPDIPQKDTRVLYIANNGEFFARIAIRFTPDEALCNKISELRQENTLFSLKTCNPCIDSALVFYTTGLEPELLRVVKYLVMDEVAEKDTDREGILVSKTGAYGLFSALLGYKRQKRLILIGSRVAALSGLLGVVAALTVSLIGVKWSFISLAIFGFHTVMSGIAAFIGFSAKKHARKPKNGKQKRSY